jgi:hypothetical protein
LLSPFGLGKSVLSRNLSEVIGFQEHRPASTLL